MFFCIKKRLVTAFFIFLTIFILLVVKLWVLQVKDGEKYAVLALEQESIYVALEEAPRGNILDRNLALLSRGQIDERVIVFPSIIRREEVIPGLAEILGVPGAELSGWLNGSPCYLPCRLSPAQAAVIKARGWKGVGVFPVSFRYGDKPLAVQVTGHLGRIASPDEYTSLSSRSNKIYRYGDLVGKTGLEAMYEVELKGGRPERAARIYRDATGNILSGSVWNMEEQVQDRSRQDLVLTIDARIQEIVENVMDEKIVKGAVVVLEAGTGDLLAMGSRPAFHPARVEAYLREGGEECFFDHCTALYPPGSIFKIAVAAAALEQGMAGSEHLLTCDGAAEHLIPCWHDAGHHNISFAQAFAVSCNPAFAKLGLSLGAPRIIEYAGKLGLENQTVIGYPAPPDQRQDLSLIAAPYNLVNSSVGQGPVLVSPVQVTAMLNTIVSGGIYRTPRLVQEIRNRDGSLSRAFASDPGQPALRPETAAVLQELMALATDSGPGEKALVPVFGSAGKTGSAQTGNSNHLVHAWFAGYAPRANPRYVITVLVEEGASGGESAAPVFRQIMEQILSLN